MQLFMNYEIRGGSGGEGGVHHLPQEVTDNFFFASVTLDWLVFVRASESD